MSRTAAVRETPATANDGGKQAWGEAACEITKFDGTLVKWLNEKPREKVPPYSKGFQSQQKNALAHKSAMCQVVKSAVC